MEAKIKRLLANNLRGNPYSYVQLHGPIILY
jgi:hypothetical protein